MFVSCTLSWCWCPWLLSNGPRRRRWSLACLDRLEWIHRHHEGPQSGSKIVIALMYNCHFVMPGLEVLKYQFIYVHKASKTMNLSSHFSIAENSGSETWQNSCTTCVWEWFKCFLWVQSWMQIGLHAIELATALHPVHCREIHSWQWTCCQIYVYMGLNSRGSTGLWWWWGSWLFVIMHIFVGTEPIYTSKHATHRPYVCFDRLDER